MNANKLQIIKHHTTLLVFLILLGFGKFATASTPIDAFLPVKSSPEVKNVIQVESELPNIILILLDDLGFFNFTSYGGKSVDGVPIKSPTIDKLLQEGMHFTNFHVRSMCSPSRRVLMTGKGLYDLERGNSTEPLSHHWMPQYMKDAGYMTGISGKWMLGRLNPIERGFDEAFIWAGHYNYWEPKIMVFNSKGYMRNLNQPEGIAIESVAFDVPVGGGAGKATLLEGKYGPDLINSFACDFVTRKADDRFFLYYPMKLIHAPFKDMPNGEKGGSAAYIEYADKLIQNLLDAVEYAGIKENTLIILTSDNGFSWQEQIDVQEGVDFFPGSKGSTLEGSTRVPFIARWPARIKAGSKYEGLVDLQDVLPTLVQIAGEDMQSGKTWACRSFLPQLFGDKEKVRDWIYIHGGSHPNPLEKEVGEFYTRGLMMRYVRGDRYKLYGDGRLYDMKTDISEKNDICLGTGSAEAENARKEMQSVLNRFKNDFERAEFTHAPRVEAPVFDLSTLPSPINKNFKYH